MTDPTIRYALPGPDLDEPADIEAAVLPLRDRLEVVIGEVEDGLTDEIAVPPLYAYAKLIGAQAVPNSVWTAPVLTEIEDANGLMSGGGQFTVPHDGLWRFEWAVGFDNNTNGGAVFRGKLEVVAGGGDGAPGPFGPDTPNGGAIDYHHVGPMSGSWERLVHSSCTRRLIAGMVIQLKGDREEGAGTLSNFTGGCELVVTEVK